jgi:hypothetical protein
VKTFWSALFALTAPTAEAQVAFQGVGSNFCFEVFASDEQVAEQTKFQLVDWFLGFVSGVNAMNVGNGFFVDLSNIGTESEIFDRFRVACLERPEERIFVVALNMVETMAESSWTPLGSTP